MTRPLHEIAADIEYDWTNVNYAAAPYLDALHTLNKITDMYYADTGKSAVMYFLANAGSWRGEKAREIKAELKGML
jgi:hypothetical protein